MFVSSLGTQENACRDKNAEMIQQHHVNMYLSVLMRGFGSWLCLYQHIFNNAHQPLLLWHRWVKNKNRKARSKKGSPCFLKHSDLYVTYIFLSGN